MSEIPTPEIVPWVRDLMQIGLTGWLILSILALTLRWVAPAKTIEERSQAFIAEMNRRDEIHRREIEGKSEEADRWRVLYERERADRIEAQSEVRATVEVLQLGIKVFDQLNTNQKPKAK